MAGTSTKVTMTLPKPMLRAADRIAAAEYRTRAEVFREALREYIARRNRQAPGVADEGGRFTSREEFERAAAAVPLDDEPYTAKERRHVERAKKAIERGDFVTLDVLKQDLAKRIAREGGRVDRRRRGRAA